MDEQSKTDQMLEFAKLGQNDGAHHKDWAIDQMVRVLLGERYESWVSEYEDRDENGKIRYIWNTGIAP